MEREPECLAPWEVPLENVNGVWGCQHFHVDHHTCLGLEKEQPIWNPKRTHFGFRFPYVLQRVYRDSTVI